MTTELTTQKPLNNINYKHTSLLTKQMKKEDYRIIFMGTPEFAITSLDTLIKNHFNIVGVITGPDKPAGRGQKLIFSPVKKYSLQKGLHLLQPEKLKDHSFLEELKKLKPDLQVVVAFRMLPENVWALPPYGTINLHASLLPQYRGAAPINWAIINGEKETGLTTFFIRHEIDTGNILMQEKTDIGPAETAGELHDRLKRMGADLLIRTIQNIIDGTITETKQSLFIHDHTELKPAPKISREDCRIRWNNMADEIFNFIRGLSPFPGAWSEWTAESNDTLFLKIFIADKEYISHKYRPGTLIVERKYQLKVACKGGFIHIKNLQQAGKKRMDVEEYLRGMRDLNRFSVVERNN
jgi:methionyl-tRNA formyltransferase